MNINTIALEQIKKKIIKKFKIRNQLIKNGIMNDGEGCLYCISSSIYKIYSIEIYKLGNAEVMENREYDYNRIYFDKITIHLQIKVPYKYMFETLLFVKLSKYRIVYNREFFTNYELIKKEFDKIKEIINNNEPLEAINKYYDCVSNITQCKFNGTLKFTNKQQQELIPKKHSDSYKNKIRNYISDNAKKGFLMHLDIPEITYNYDSKVQVFTVLSKCKTQYTEFLCNIETIKCGEITNMKFAKLLLFDMLNGTHIKNNFFLCSKERATEVFKKIMYYYNNYKCDEKIKKAYLYDIYKEGENEPIDIQPTKRYHFSKEELMSETCFSRINIIKKKLNDECGSGSDNLDDLDDLKKLRLSDIKIDSSDDSINCPLHKYKMEQETKRQIIKSMNNGKKQNNDNEKETNNNAITNNDTKITTPHRNFDINLLKCNKWQKMLKDILGDDED